MTCAKMMCQRRFGKIVAFFLVFWLVIACYNADTATSFFGKEEDVCQGENCGENKAEDTENIVDKGGVGEEATLDPGTNSQDTEHAADIDKIDDHEAAGTSDDSEMTKGKEINVIITFTNVQKNPKLQKKFQLTVSSMLQHATVPLAIHVIGDPESQKIAAEILKKVETNTKYRTVELDVDQLAQDLHKIVKPMQEHFSHKPGAYYSHSLFFLSIALHQVMPENMHKAILLDADLKFMDDVAKLHDRFRLFNKDTVIGIGNEMQPVYRHAFWKYRQENPGTRVGQPGPNGLPGFNSGVLLLNLDNMRSSTLYNSLITVDSVKRLTEGYHFKGHLGDQDFFTLLAMKYEWLFHVLPCSWNRQLCTWWREHGYEDVWDQYHTCDMDIKIYHGNCDTTIPY